MRYKEFKVRDIPNWGTYLRKQWRDSFASHLSKEVQREIWVDDFLWHICSWKKVSCLEKHQAIEAFLHKKKQKCTIFYQLIEDAYLLDQAESLTVQDLPYDRLHMYHGDIYIMDWDRKWTFILTHEEECGPYFIQR